MDSVQSNIKINKENVFHLFFILLFFGLLDWNVEAGKLKDKSVSQLLLARPLVDLHVDTFVF